MGAIASAWLHGQPAADAAAWAWMRTPPPPTPGCGCLDVAAGRDKLHGLQLSPGRRRAPARTLVETERERERKEKLP